MRRPAVLALGCTLLVLLAAGASGARNGTWLWPVAVPGDRAALGAALRGDAVRAGVTAGSLRELATSGEGAGRLTLLAGRRGGETVLATETGARLGTVERVPEATSPLRAFSTPDGRLVGVARGDVGRVVAVLGDGRAVELPLNAWRAFAYDDGEPVATLTAYDFQGRSLGSLGLPPTPVRVADQWRGSGGTGRLPQLYGAFATGRIRNGISVTPPATLARVDPRTLRRIPGPSLEIPSPGMLALSPSGRRLATASPPSGAVGIVDLSRMRWFRRWRAGAGPWSLVRVLAWPKEDRLLEVVQRMSKPYRRYVRARSLVVVDPTSGRVVTRRKLTNKLGITGSVSAGGRLVMLMQSSGFRGSTALLVVASADGDVRQVTVKVGSTRRVLRFNQLVVAPAGDRAYVVVSGGLVVDVDLTSLQATYHRLRPPAQTSRELPAALSPRAAMLGRNIAVVGLFGGASGVPPLGGTYLVDTGSWNVRVLDRRSSFFAAGGDVLATFGPVPFLPAGGPPQARGTGLSVFDGEGRLRFHLYGTRRLQSAEFVLGYGHALAGARPRLRPGTISTPVWTDRVFDLGTGRALGARRLSTQPYLIYRGSPSVGEVPTSSSKPG